MIWDLCGCLRADAVPLDSIPWLPGSFFAEFGARGIKAVATKLGMVSSSTDRKFEAHFVRVPRGGQMTFHHDSPGIASEMSHLPLAGRLASLGWRG